MVLAKLIARLTVVIVATLIGLLSTFTPAVNAQPAGVGLAGRESPSVTDGVDVFSGQLENVLPLVSVQGRGDASVGLYFPMRNLQWYVRDTGTVTSNDRVYYFYKPDLTGPGYSQAAEYNYYRGGYAMLGRLVVETKFSGWYFMETPSITEITFTSNNGTIVRFRDVLTNGQPLDARGRGCVMSGFQPPNPPPACSRGRVFRSISGENITFVADADVYDMIFYDAFGNPSPWSAQSNIAGTLYLSNGTRMRVENNFNHITKITDRNGNTINFEYGAAIAGYMYHFLNKITDSLNREISLTYGDHSQPSYFDEIVYKGFGNSERRIRINYTAVENALIPGESLGLQIFPGVTTRCYMYSQEPCDPTPGGSLGPPHYAPSGTVASSIVLANGREYQFYYNRYRELARVKTPTGAYTDYSYSGTIGAQADGFSPPVYWGGGGIYRRVASVKNFEETGQLVSEKTFSNIPQYVEQSHPSFPVLDNLIIDIKDASGTVLTKSRHYFYETAGVLSSGYASYGKEYKSEILDPVSQNVLRRTETTWQQREAFPWCDGYLGYYACFPDQVNFPNPAPALDPRITEIKTTLETGQVTTKTFSYDQYNNVTDTYEYDFGQGQPGPFLRRSHADYVTDANYTSHTGAYLLRLKSQAWISTDIEGNNKAAFTQFEYDNYASDTHHAPLVPRSNVSGFDVSYHAGLTRRGNVTAVISFSNAQNQTGPVGNYLQYDIVGNVVKSIDARDYATTFDFSDRFGAPDTEAQSNTQPSELAAVGKSSFAFATKITNALGQSTYLQFDYYLGRSINAEDINGVVSSSSFNDSVDRPTQTIQAANDSAAKRQTSFAYDDVNRVITITSDQTVFNDPYPLKSQAIYNSFGRAIESRLYEGGANYIARRVQYDALGRAFKTSNPFRPGETLVWTTTEFDALGRPISVTTPDNAAVTSSYSGNMITATDQAGKQRKSITDALGRLNQIYEAPENPNYNYLTSYSYDVLDNLITVNQGSQTRSFVYDSLKRLVSVANPESGMICYGTIVNGQCQGNGYDANGNVTITTDKRGTVTTFLYDPLNRITGRNYSDGTPAVTLAYDSTTIANGKGRLASVSSAVSTFSYGDYDAVGLPLAASQTLGTQTYSMSYGYDLAGHVKSITYPSGHVVTYNYDGAGRLGDKDAQNLAFTGNLGDGTQHTYASAITYSPFGAPTREQYGTTTTLFRKMFYNIRGQMFDTRVSSVNDTWDWNRGRLSLYFSSNHIWGGSGADNNGSVRFMEHWIPPPNATLDQAQYLIEDSYSYDPLNRLSVVNEQSRDIGAGGSWTPRFAQAYSYDRYGNRTINAGGTWGTGINNKQFTVDTTNNRLGVPSGQSGAMNYDDSGNLITDTYSGAAVIRAYDAENQMTSETTYNSVVSASYSYDGHGRRVKRTVGGVETWQVYGLSGELLAEYSANANALSPQKEYGYRNGELLVTATMTSGWGPPPSFSGPDPLVAGHEMKLENLTELRSAVNQLRQYAGLSPFNFTVDANPERNVTTIKADHVRQLRTALEQARAQLGLSTGGYAHPTLAENSSIIYAVDFQELRNQVLSAWNSSTGSVDMRWLVTDHLGTPRMIFDQTGSLANVSRHDYLPFGEEVPANFRTGVSGYATADHVRQKFTGYERDAESGLDYAQARYYAGVQGRFTSPDAMAGSATIPQSLNAYSYVINNPVNATDPTGLSFWDVFDTGNGYLNAFYIDGVLARPEQALWMLGSGTGVVGPFNTTQYDTTMRTFVRLIAVQGPEGTGTGWIPHNFKYIGDFSWGWTNYDPNALKDGDPTSYTASFRYIGPNGFHWYRGQLVTTMYGALRNAHGDAVLYLTQAVETDWGAQMAIGGGLNALRLGLRGLITTAFSQFGKKGAVDKALDAAVDFLGPGARTITNRAGDKIFLSKDGMRRIRFDINRPYPHKNPHIHVEEHVNGVWEGTRIYPKGLKPE